MFCGPLEKKSNPSLHNPWDEGSSHPIINNHVCAEYALAMLSTVDVPSSGLSPCSRVAVERRRGDTGPE